MKKIRGSALLLAALIVSSCTVLTGCQPEQARTQYEVSSYQGQLTDGQTKSDYTPALFDRNDKKADCPDPFELDNTAVDGWYDLYGTESSLFCYRSRVLMDWERVGNALDNMGWDESKKISEIRRTTWKDIWAPEVVYDAETKLYYLFFSASPDRQGQAVKGAATELLMVATSTSPTGPFTPVNFKNSQSCGYLYALWLSGRRYKT